MTGFGRAYSPISAIACFVLFHDFRFPYFTKAGIITQRNCNFQLLGTTLGAITPRFGLRVFGFTPDKQDLAHFVVCHSFCKGVAKLSSEILTCQNAETHVHAMHLPNPDGYRQPCFWDLRSCCKSSWDSRLKLGNMRSGRVLLIGHTSENVATRLLTHVFHLSSWLMLHITHVSPAVSLTGTMSVSMLHEIPYRIFSTHACLTVSAMLM